MKNLKLDVVRFENEDVIATSCGSAVLNFYVTKGDDEIDTEFADMDWLRNATTKQIRDLSNSIYSETFDDEDKVKLETGWYDADANGNIEACSNYNNHRGNNWVEPS